MVQDNKVAAPPLSWSPRSCGDTYCAPACGRGCKRAWYDACVDAAAKLAARCGAGWKPHVWENLGWHYHAVSPCGRIKVSPDGFKKNNMPRDPRVFTAYLGVAGGIGGRWVGDGTTPKEAVADVIAKAKAERDAIDAILHGLV